MCYENISYCLTSVFIIPLKKLSEVHEVEAKVWSEQSSDVWILEIQNDDHDHGVLNDASPMTKYQLLILEVPIANSIDTGTLDDNAGRRSIPSVVACTETCTIQSNDSKHCNVTLSFSEAVPVPSLRLRELVEPDECYSDLTKSISERRLLSGVDTF